MSKMKKNLWRHVLQLGVIAVIAGFILKVFVGGGPAECRSLLSVRGTAISRNLPEFKHTGMQHVNGADHDGSNLGNRRYSFQQTILRLPLPSGYGNGMDGRFTQKNEDKHQHLHRFSCR